MNRLSIEKRSQILGLLVEGNSLRAASRLADCSLNTVTKFLVELGCAVAAFQNEKLVHLPCKRLQVDEIWSFAYCKQKNVEKAKAAPEGAGDVWTWTAICADTKLIPSWLVGNRDAMAGYTFMNDLASRMAGRVQVTSDGFKVYEGAVREGFGIDVDYAVLEKIYGPADVAFTSGRPDTRYSPAACIGCREKKVIGNPDPKHVSTSYVERQNLTMRMSMRRFTRLTNGFSKKVENHAHAVALHFMYYNFGRVHKSLRVTPAMEASITDHVWTLQEIAELTDINYQPKKRGPYKKRAVS